MPDEKPNYYAILTAAVRYDSGLVPNAKLLYGEITALSNQRGYCWASNAYFARLYGVDRMTVSKWVSALAERGHIKVTVDAKTGNKRRIQIVNNVPKLVVSNGVT